MIDANLLQWAGITLASFTLIELILIFVFVLGVAPRRARRLVHEDLVGTEEEKGLVDTVLIPKVRGLLEQARGVMHADLVGTEEEEGLVDTVLLPKFREQLDSLVDEKLLPKVREELQAVLRDAQGRIEMAQQAMQRQKEELMQQLAAASAQQEAMTASDMGKASGKSRQTFAMQEEEFEAHITKLSPAFAPMIIGTAKQYFETFWKSSVKAGPQAIPAVLEKVRSFGVNVGGASPNGQTQQQGRRLPW